MPKNRSLDDTRLNFLLDLGKGVKEEMYGTRIIDSNIIHQIYEIGFQEV